MIEKEVTKETIPEIEERHEKEMRELTKKQHKEMAQFYDMYK